MSMAKKPSKASLQKLDETGRRKQGERRKKGEPAAAKVERRKTHRRRQIDPTTCEREYSDKEIEFMQALDEYKRLSGRMFPTCSEILEVLHNLGYRKVADSQDVYNPHVGAPVDAPNFSSETTQTA